MGKTLIKCNISPATTDVLLLCGEDEGREVMLPASVLRRAENSALAFMLSQKELREHYEAAAPTESITDFEKSLSEEPNDMEFFNKHRNKGRTK